MENYGWKKMDGKTKLKVTKGKTWTEKTKTMDGNNIDGTNNIHRNFWMEKMGRKNK